MEKIKIKNLLKVSVSQLLSQEKNLGVLMHSMVPFH